MPIKSWDKDIRLPRFGMIRLGETGPKGNPIALDHFVVPEEVAKVYGEKPRELDILLPSENMDDILTAWYKRYGRSAGLICRGDEENALVSALHVIGHPQEYPVRMGQDGAYYGADDSPLSVERLGGTRWVRIPCDPTVCKYAARNDDSTPSCRPIAILNFLMPDVPGAIGVYSIATGSKKSYQNLLAGITLIRNRLGYVSDIPIKLRVSMVEFHPVVKGKRITTKKPIIDIRLAVTYREALALAQERRLQIAAKVNLDLEPLDESTPPETFYDLRDEPEASETPAETQTNARQSDERQLSAQRSQGPAESSGEAEDFTPPCDYDQEDTQEASPAKEPEREEKPKREEPPKADPKPTPERQGADDKSASEKQLSYIKNLAEKRLSPEKPDTWPPFYAKFRETGMLTSKEAGSLITDLKLTPPLEMPPQAEKQPEKKPEATPPAKPESDQPKGSAPDDKPKLALEKGASVTFMVIGMPRPTGASQKLAVTAKAKVTGTEAVWEISWYMEGEPQVRPNGYKYRATVENVLPEARKLFVKDLKVES